MVSQSRDQRQASGVEARDLSANSAEDRSAHEEDEEDDDDGGDSTLVAAGSRKSASRSQASSVPGSPRPMHLTRNQVKRIKGHRRDHNQAVLSTDDILHGLSLSPLPSDLTQHKKRPRTFEEVIEDNSPRDKDKLANELDKMDMDERSKRQKTETELPFHPKKSQAGPSNRKATTGN